MMASASDIVTLVSSVVLRLSVYIFLRWVSACLPSSPRRASNVLAAQLITYDCRYPPRYAPTMDGLEQKPDDS